MVVAAASGSSHYYGPSLVYVSTNGQQISISVNATNGDWHDVALTYRYALTNTALIVDGNLAGNLSEQYVPDQFTLGGPAGASGACTFTITAGQDLSGHRMVSVNSSGQAVYADKDTPATVRQVLGLTTGAAMNGVQATVLQAGEIAEPSWTLDPGTPVYLGNNGLLTQILPATGVILQVGVPLTAKMLLVDIKKPISLT